MQKQQYLDLSYPILLDYIDRKAYAYFLSQMGKETKENRESYKRTVKEAATLIQSNKEYLIPKGVLVLSDQKEFWVTELAEEEYLADVTIALSCTPYKTESETEQFVMHLLQISYMNAVRDYVRVEVVPALYQRYYNERAPFVTQLFGPGYFDMPMERMKEMVTYLQGERIGLSCKSTMLIPEMSFVGVIFVMKKQAKSYYACEYCKANLGCEYCMIRSQL